MNYCTLLKYQGETTSMDRYVHADLYLSFQDMAIKPTFIIHQATSILLMYFKFNIMSCEMDLKTDD